jgi:hypothetical protein
MMNIRSFGHRYPVLKKGLVLALLLSWSTTGLRVESHEGPPFPILMDEPVGSYKVSVWTDPDIGIGKFFVVIEPMEGVPFEDVHSVRVGVAPVSGRLEEVVYTAEPERVRYGARYRADVEFDQGEMWKVRILIEGAGGSGELLSEVEATPDGTIGPIGMFVYLLPFLAVGFLWLKAVLRQREQRRAAAEAQPGPDATKPMDEPL